MLLKVFIILFCFNQLSYAYLDPSTGSLLLSSLVAIFASFIFFIKNIFYKFLNILDLLRGGGTSSLASRDKNSHSIVFYSEGRQYYNVFAPILDTLDSWNIDYVFFTSDEEDIAFSKNKNTRFIGKGSRAYAFLNTLKADIVIMTTPGLDVLEIKRSKGVKHYCHIVHSLGTPNYRAFGMDYYDSVFVNSVMQEQFVNKVMNAHNIPLKDIRIVGSTYCDKLCEIKDGLKIEKTFFEISEKEQKKVILLSPSWGKEGALSKYGMELIRNILDSGFLLIIRPHPQSLISEKKLIDQLQKLTENERVVWDIDTPNVYAMEQSDIMISDFSGIIFDYLCLYEKPVLTLDFAFDHSGYDSADIDGMWEFDIFHKIGGRISQSDFPKIKDVVEEVLKNKTFDQAIQETKKLLWTKPCKSGEYATRAILEIRQAILEEQLGKYKSVAQELLVIQKILDNKEQV